MPTARLPLVGSFNERGIDGAAALDVSEDQRFLNCAFLVVQNPVTGKVSVYIEKRPGWMADSIVAAGSASTGLIKPLAFNAPLTAFGDTNSTIYVGTTSVGAITGRALHFNEVLISSVSYVTIKSSDGTGWYYVNGAKDDLTYVGDTHNGTAIIDSLDSTTGIYSGQAWSGTNVPAGARVLTVDSASQITLNANCTGDGTDTTFTKTPIAKILDADFITTGTYISAFVDMDGFLFYTTEDGNIRNSDLNSVTAYTNTNFLAVQQSPDPPVGLVRQKNYVVVFGTGSKEAFINGGNATGSPLQRVPQGFENIGAIDQRSIVAIEDDVYYVSTPNAGDVGVYRMRGLQSTKVSPPNVDRIIGTVTGVDGTIYANAFRLGGYPYLGLVMSTASEGAASLLLLESSDKILLEDGDDIEMESAPSQVSSFQKFFIYNAGLNIWGEWDCSEATFIDGGGSGLANQLLATSRMDTGGKVYRIDPVADGNVYQDDGSTYSLQVRTSRIDHGTGKRKFIDEIRFVGDRQSAGTALLESSDDDYETWDTVGTFDLTQMEPKIRRCGSYKGGRAYRLTHSHNGPFRAEALEIDFRVASI